MVSSPLTGSSDTKFLKTIQTDDLIKGWREQLKIDITEEFRKHKTINLYQCNETKLKFFLPLDVTGSAKLYEQLQNIDWYYMSDKWEFKVALRDLSRCKNVIEIGSGSGAFLQLASQNGLTIQGLELNSSSVEVSRKKGLRVEEISLKDASKIYTEKFDGLCSFQVLEHVSDPHEFIDCSIKLLRPGGKLIYSVPNEDSYLKHSCSLLNMPPHHMHLWYAETFKSLESIFPLRLKEIKYEPLSSYHINNYLYTYKNHFAKRKSLGKFILNTQTIPLLHGLLNLGLRNLIRGHTLYGVFEKT